MKDDIIRKKYKLYIEQATFKNLHIFIIVAILILGYFTFSDLFIRTIHEAVFTRIIPLFLSLYLLILRVLPKSNKKLIITIYSILIAYLPIMLYALLILYKNTDTFESTVSSTILVIFIMSILLQTNTLISIIIYFLPITIFVILILTIFKFEKENLLTVINIFPMIILGFLTNFIQNKLRFNNFKSKYLLEKEKNKADKLYKNTLVMNKNLQTKNQEITQQRDVIKEKKNEIERQHKHITDSINYAQKIQEAMLPSKEIFSNNFKNYFIYYNPKDIVSGDFYWIEKIEDKIIYAVADCTGHGVPGAMLSLLGISLLNKITAQNVDLKASGIMEQLRKELKKSLKQTGEDKYETKDGMDMALCVLDTKTKKIQFSGAYNSLYIHRKNKLIELKSDRQPIGLYPKERDFTNHEFQLETNDILYSFSDGFSDQFNDKGEKYNIKRFKKLLANIADKNLSKQKEILETEFKTWKSTKKQIDDIVIIGIKI